MHISSGVNACTTHQKISDMISVQFGYKVKGHLTPPLPAISSCLQSYSRAKHRKISRAHPAAGPLRCPARTTVSKLLH